MDYSWTLFCTQLGLVNGTFHQKGSTRAEGRYPFFETRNLSEVDWPVTGQKGLEFFCLFLLGGTESEMSKNLGRMGNRQSSGAFVLKKYLFTIESQVSQTSKGLRICSK